MNKFLIYFVIIFISLISNNSYSKDIVKELIKYQKRGVHPAKSEYSKEKIEKIKDYFSYIKGYKILKKDRVSGLSGRILKAKQVSGRYGTRHSWDLFKYKIKRAKINEIGEKEETEVNFYYYKSLVKFNLSKKRPLLVITPTIRGIKKGIYVNIEPKWAEHFASRGYNVILVQLGNSFLQLNRPLSKLDNWVRSKIIDQRVILDFANKTLKDEIDVRKIIVYGSSLGGIRSIITMGLEKERIALGVTVAAGGNFSDLVVTTNQEEVVAYRDYRMIQEGFNKQYPSYSNLNNNLKKFVSKKLSKHYKKLDPKSQIDLNIMLNREALYKYIKENTKTEPLYFSKERNYKDDLLMYISLKDSKVRSKTQVELWDALGRPKYILNGRIFRNHGPFILDVARSKLSHAQRWIEEQLFKRGLIDNQREIKL